MWLIYFAHITLILVKASSEKGSQKIFDTKTVRNHINDVVIDIALNMIPKQSKVYGKIEFHMKVMVKNLLKYD